MSTGLKTFLILLIIVVFGAIGYFLLSDGEISLPSSSTSSPLQTNTGEPVSGMATQSPQTIDADQVGQEFLAQLLNIRSIKLRDDIFSSPSFISLTDYTIELIQLGNEGRINPFAPFGVDTQNSFFEAGAGMENSMSPESQQFFPTFGQGMVIPFDQGVNN